MSKRKNSENISCIIDKEVILKKPRINDDDDIDFIPKTPEYEPEYALESSSVNEKISVERLYNIAQSVNPECLETFSSNTRQIYGYDFYKLGNFNQEPVYNPSIVLQQQSLPQLVINNNMETETVSACDTSIHGLNVKPIASTITTSKFSKTSRPYVSICLNFSDISMLCIKCFSINCIC